MPPDNTPRRCSADGCNRHTDTLPPAASSTLTCYIHERLCEFKILRRRFDETNEVQGTVNEERPVQLIWYSTRLVHSIARKTKTTNRRKKEIKDRMMYPHNGTGLACGLNQRLRQHTTPRLLLCFALHRIKLIELLLQEGNSLRSKYVPQWPASCGRGGR